MKTVKRNKKTKPLLSFEYIDRDKGSKIVQVGMFEKITDKTSIKAGDRFICPVSEEYRNGIVDSKTMNPILLFAKKVSEYHITFWHYEKSGGNPAIAWDLCYLLREDI